MRDHIHKILKDHWGFTEFRPLQEDIIVSAMNSKDTLALLPTGGGKSICFQVPVMARDGIGIVISPLIALMTDQVQNLKKQNINALALTSGLSYRELDMGLDNCVNGLYKFLYISPERLQSELVQERIKRMKVNLLVVDEAHCISQWGYDFRPPYTQLAQIRKLIPQVAVLALTATATPRVVDDIQQKLEFRENLVIQQSFYRPNLFYNVNHTEKKWSKTIEVLEKIRGTAIIYVRNRKHTVEIAEWLQKNNIPADYYHAGLSAELRKKKQHRWIHDQTRVIVCTNAFGMGIDKPNVRLVLHLDLPESLEAYFQEAGRAGRDGLTAYSLVLVGPSDIGELKRKHLESFPDLTFVKRVYQALSNFLQLAAGTGEGQSFPFHFGSFLQQYDLPSIKTYQSLRILEKEGLLTLNEGFRQPSRIYIRVDRTALYDFQLRNPKLDNFIKTLSRSYGGLDVEYTAINEQILAQRLDTTEAIIQKTLIHLKKQGILDYIPYKGDSQIFMNHPRKEIKYLAISNENLKDRYRDKSTRIKAVEAFIKETSTCRSMVLLSYFGEKNAFPCGYCDICRAIKDQKNQERKKEFAIAEIRKVIKNEGSFRLTELPKKLKIKKYTFNEGLRWLIDAGEVKMVKEGVYQGAD